MKRSTLMKDVTGQWFRESYDWLKREDGCCSVVFNSDGVNDYAVCIGWHQTGPDRIPQPDGTFKDVPGDDGWRIAWKIGRQSVRNIMQCDFDIDWEMPYNTETGDVDDTVEVIEVEGRRPKGYRSWNALAAHVRKTARRIWKDWREE